MNDVEVVTATIDIEDVRAHRSRSSRNMQASLADRYHRIEVDFPLTKGKFAEIGQGLIKPEIGTEVRYHLPEEEIA